MKISRKFQAYVELSAAMFIVGSSVVAAKIITRSLPVFLAGGLRFAIALLILIPLLIKAEGLPAVTPKEAGILFLQALTGIFGFSLFLLYGLKFTTAAASGIVTSTTPAVLGIISFLFLKEPLEKRKIVGIAMAVAGIMTLNIPGLSPAGGRDASAAIPWLGNTLVFGAVICEALFTVLGKALSKRLTPLAISTYVSVCGFLMFLPFGIFEALRFEFETVAAQDWLSLVYYGVVVTVGGFFLMYSGVSKVPVNTAAVFTGVLPLSALLLSALILGERIHPAQIAGFFLILIGIIHSSRETAGIKGTPSRPEAYHEL